MAARRRPPGSCWGCLSLAPPSGQEFRSSAASPLSAPAALGSGRLGRGVQPFKGRGGGLRRGRLWPRLGARSLPKGGLSPASLPPALVCCPGWKQVGPECPLGEWLSVRGASRLYTHRHSPSLEFGTGGRAKVRQGPRPDAVPSVLGTPKGGQSCRMAPSGGGCTDALRPLRGGGRKETVPSPRPSPPAFPAALCLGADACQEREICIRPAVCRCRPGFFGANCSAREYRPVGGESRNRSPNSDGGRIHPFYLGFPGLLGNPFPQLYLGARPGRGLTSLLIPFAWLGRKALLRLAPGRASGSMTTWLLGQTLLPASPTAG